VRRLLQSRGYFRARYLQRLPDACRTEGFDPRRCGMAEVLAQSFRSIRGTALARARRAEPIDSDARHGGLTPSDRDLARRRTRGVRVGRCARDVRDVVDRTTLCYRA